MKDQSFSWSQDCHELNMSHFHTRQATLLQSVSSQGLPSSSNIDMEGHSEDSHILAIKEMMYKIAAMQPVDIDPVTIQKPQRKNVRISTDPQSVAARLRRERISERIRILRRMVPGGSKMDTASMLDEAILYVKFLKKLVAELQSNHPYTSAKNASMEPRDWSIPHMTSNMNFIAASSSTSSMGPALASSSLGNHFSGANEQEENYMVNRIR